MRWLLVALISIFPQSLMAGRLSMYAVLANIDDTKLVLESAYGERYVVNAKIFCIDTDGFDEGDILMATKDLGVCTSTTLISRSSGKTCDVWCF